MTEGGECDAETRMTEGGEYDGEARGQREEQECRPVLAANASLC